MNRYFGTHTLGGEWHALLPRYQLLAQRVKGRRVLDIGCGTGIGSSLLLEMGAESVYGVDHRPEVVQLARLKHDKPGLSFHVMLWEAMEFDDDSFDLVVCLDPASPVTDHNLLVEVRRVLRGHGEYICAVERSLVAGLETLLPRYGYSDPSNRVDINPTGTRVPQIGALRNFFSTVVHVTQRPQLGYIFERDQSVPPAEEPSTNPRIVLDEQTPPAPASPPPPSRRVPDGPDGGLWQPDAAEEGMGGSGEGSWIPVDRQLELDDTSQGGIQIFFCGDAHLPPAPSAEIRLPYYPLVERFAQVIADLQARQSPSGEVPAFDEVVDAPEGFGGARRHPDHDTQEFGRRAPWDENPTGLRHQAVSSDSALAAQGASASGETPFVDLDAYYFQMRRRVDELELLTRQAIAERDQYINHLVGMIHQLEDQSRAPHPSGEIDAAQWRSRETTNVFKIDALTQGAPSMPARDDLAEDRSANAAVSASSEAQNAAASGEESSQEVAEQPAQEAVASSEAGLHSVDDGSDNASGDGEAKGTSDTANEPSADIESGESSDRTSLDSDSSDSDSSGDDSSDDDSSNTDELSAEAKPADQENAADAAAEEEKKTDDEENPEEGD